MLFLYSTDSGLVVLVVNDGWRGGDFGIVFD